MGPSSTTFRTGYRGTITERMANKTLRGSNDECWPWTGARDTSGYGIIRVRGRLEHANRLAYEHTHGPIPEGHDVMHRCDNPPCVNPKHLLTGTRKDNSDDKISKGRTRWLKHDQHPMAKLTPANVADIRARWATGERNATALGRAFGVNRTTIRGIVEMRNWR